MDTDIERAFQYGIAHANEWEPWPHRQFKAFNRYDLEPPNFMKAMRTIASMYWQGMEREFCDAVELPDGLTETWAQSYVTYIRDCFPDFPEIPEIPEASEIPKIPREMMTIPTAGPYFVITHISEAGTSETGRVINAETESFDNSSQANITYDKLSGYTSARIERLPSLKDLGILRVYDLNTHTTGSSYVIYCWLYDDVESRSDPDIKPTMYVLKPFNARKPAVQCSDAEHALFNVSPGISRTSTVICLEDVIVKINEDSSPHIFTKAKKTYYTLSVYPIPHVNPVRVDYAYARIDRSATVKIALARYIFGVPDKGQTYIGVYYEDGKPCLCSINNNSMYGNVQLPRFIRKLTQKEKKWLSGLMRKAPLILEHVQSCVNLDQLISEFM